MRSLTPRVECNLAYGHAVESLSRYGYHLYRKMRDIPGDKKGTTLMLKSFIHRKLNLNAKEETAEELSRLLRHRGNVFFHGMAFTVFSVLLFFVVYNIYIDLFLAALYDLVAAAVLAGVLLLCYHGRFVPAKVIFLSALNIFVLLFSLSYPTEVGLYLIYIPLITVVLAIFDSAQRKLRHVFIVISLTNMITLIFFRPDLFPTVSLRPEMIQHAFLINLSTTLVILFITLYYLMYVIDRTDGAILTISEALRRKNEELDEAYRKLDRFTYSVSHDLRAPLNSIKGLSTLGLYDTSATADYFQKIAQCTDKLDDFIKTSLSYYKSSPGSDRSNVDIAQLIQDVIQHFAPVEKDHPIRFEADTDLPHRQYEIDQVLFRSIIGNLVSNAIKYHDHQKTDPFVRIEAQYRQSSLHLKIADNGRGIDAAHLHRIFDAFYIAGPAAEKSTGVGLHLVKDAVSKMNGTIQVQSNPGKGTLFTLMIPAQPAENADPLLAAGFLKTQR